MAVAVVVAGDDVDCSERMPTIPDVAVVVVAAADGEGLTAS